MNDSLFFRGGHRIRTCKSVTTDGFQIHLTTTVQSSNIIESYPYEMVRLPFLRSNSVSAKPFPSADVLGFYFFLSPVQFIIILRFLYQALLIFLTTNNKVVFTSTPNRSRTYNPRLRRAMLYPVELWVQINLGRATYRM